LQPTSGDFYLASDTDLTIANTELDGGIYWSGTGTLTLRNVILRPDWKKVWATVTSVKGGNVVIDHVTIAGVNVGAARNFTKGFIMEGGGRLDVGYLNESRICQNDLGSGPMYIHDSYIHDIGSRDGSTCHATGIEDEVGGAGPITIRHNTIDEFPGKTFEPATDGAIFLQGLYGKVPKLVIDDNFLHSAYSSIEISNGGRYHVTGPEVTNNCLAWPPDGAPVVDPKHTIKVWSGNTKCDAYGRNTHEPVPAPAAS
jgi:hypothetical protein